jgi:hypothetical protein
MAQISFCPTSHTQLISDITINSDFVIITTIIIPAVTKSDPGQIHNLTGAEE